MTLVDCLAWSPNRNELAFSRGRHAQVWDVERGAMAKPSKGIATTLQFDNSSVLDFAWHPQGEQLAVSGHFAVKVWSRQNWESDPIVHEIRAAGVAIAISPQGKYLASGNLDSTLMVWGWESPYPWRMTGFPGS